MLLYLYIKLRKIIQIFSEIKPLLLAFSFLLSIFSCTNNNQNETQEEKTIASVSTDLLKESDFKQQQINSSNKTDSIAFAQKAIENWALETVLYQEALAKLEPSEMNVEKQMNDYKKQLINLIYTRERDIFCISFPFLYF